MTKRQAHALAKKLGVEILPDATGAQVIEEIQGAVDEAASALAGGGALDAMAVAVGLLAAAAEAGITPTPPEPVDEPDQDPEAPEPDDVAPEVEDAELAVAITSMEMIPAPRTNPSHTLPAVEEFNAAMNIASHMANSKMVPESYRGRPDDVLAAYMFGRELGLNLMTALRDIYIIDGRPAIAAHRQLGIIRSGGVKILESEATAERAYIKAQRTDTGEIMAVDFTMEEAKKIVSKAGKHLVDKENWRSYPADMLWARAVGRLSRRLGSDLIGGMPPYVAEEVGDFSGWDVAYGEDGAPVIRRGAATRDPEIPEYRKEKPDYNWPDNWRELTDRLTERITNVADAIEWVRQANQSFAQMDSVKEMTDTQRRIMFQKVSGVLFTLDESGDDLALHDDPRPVIQAAFARYLDGVVLDGPPWRIGPHEDDRPTYEPVPASHAGADGDTEHERLKDAENEATDDEEPPEPVEGEIVDPGPEHQPAAGPTDDEIRDAWGAYQEDPNIQFGEPAP